MIKSGGEWISSVELENQLMAHPAVREAAVIAIADERWGERPLACVVLAEGAQVGADELREHLRERVARWWLPERVRVHRRAAEDERRQVRQEGAARRAHGGSGSRGASGMRLGGVTVRAVAPPALEPAAAATSRASGPR